jgi:hypothetical protein
MEEGPAAANGETVDQLKEYGNALFKRASL